MNGFGTHNFSVLSHFGVFSSSSQRFTKIIIYFELLENERKKTIALS
jgi:hypothetical protein